MYAKYSNNSNQVTLNEAYNELSYAAHVFDPEKTESARIPSSFPIHTALLHSDRIDTLTTNASGHLLIKVNISDAALSGSGHFTSYCAAGLNPWSPSVGGTTTEIGTINPSRVAAGAGMAIRLVAYKIKLEYIGSELNRSGYFFGAHAFDVSDETGGGTAPTLSELQDGPEFEIHSTLDGVEVIYKPYDNSYLEFTKDPTGAGSAISSASQVFRPYMIMAGIVGGQASTACVLVRQYVTYEYIPTVAIQDTVELALCKGDPSIVSEMKNHDLVRSTNEVKEAAKPPTGFLTQVKNKMMDIGKGALDYVGGNVGFLAGKLARKGIELLPGGKIGLDIAETGLHFAKKLF